MQEFSRGIPERTVGLDLGDRNSVYCIVDREGEVIERGQVATRPGALLERFSRMPASRVVLEVGTHSPWVSRLLVGCGHEVVVANARQLQLISKSTTKSDRSDAEMLARLGRMDPYLLHPIQHRGEQVQADRALLRARDALVRARTSLILSVRGQVKSFGERLPSCSAEAFASKAAAQLPEVLREALAPAVEQIHGLTQQIREYDRLVESAGRERYPETEGLRQIAGVGALTAVAYVTTIEDPERFATSREVGPFLGLVPRRDQSGERDPRLGITKAGDAYLRRLLVQAAHYILGPFGPDCELRRYGERILEQGGRGAKRRAVVAVARKLAVLLHQLWISGVTYEPWHRTEPSQRAA